ncbi:MAG: hypothetical protein WA133_05505 [Syntrophales bacterium]
MLNFAKEKVLILGKELLLIVLACVLDMDQALSDFVLDAARLFPMC